MLFLIYPAMLVYFDHLGQALLIDQTVSVVWPFNACSIYICSTAPPWSDRL